MKRIYINEEVCMGCGLCEVYCRLEHSKSTDLVKAFTREKVSPRLQVHRSSPVSFSLPCRHCQEPYCVYSCLTGALHREPDGIVTVDEAKCAGCWTCILACPYGVIRPEKERSKIAKCDLCLGNGTPACVAHCPNEALVYAEVEANGKHNEIPEFVVSS